MKRISFLSIALLVTAPMYAQSAVTKAQIEANEQHVRDFFKAGQATPDLMASFLAENYIQHNPRFVKYDEDHHVTGRQGFLDALKSGILRPPVQPAGAPEHARLPPRSEAFIMAEGDLVTIVWKQQRPDPTDPSRMYDSFSFDTFRFNKDGKFAEHWDGAVL